MKRDPQLERLYKDLDRQERKYSKPVPSPVEDFINWLPGALSSTWKERVIPALSRVLKRPDNKGDDRSPKP